jgi:hypothetical protein
MYRIRYWLMSLLITASAAYAQDADSLSVNTSQLLSAEDSLSIFSLIDSLLHLEDAAGSQFALRISYNSNVLSAGRTLGIQNFGLAPGVSYYHKSGLYADLSGYWSKDFDPSYYLTVASVGYMHDLSDRFSIMAGYDRYFYNMAGQDSYIPYKNTLSVTPIMDFKPLSISANYAFYFGDQYAHRIMPGLSLTLEKRRLWNIDRVAFLPSVFALMGNEVITKIEFVPPKTFREAVDNVRTYGTRFSVVEVSTNVFGMMNYAFSAPLSITHRQWMFTFSWTYNIPKALPGETLTLSESTYLSGSLMYIIDLRRK